MRRQPVRCQSARRQAVWCQCVCVCVSVCVSVCVCVCLRRQSVWCQAVWRQPVWCQSVRCQSVWCHKLCDVNLCDVKLCDVKLCDVNLCHVNLCDVKLCDVNLCGVCLCDANLCNVNLCAQLPRTQFTHNKPPNPHASKTSTQNFRISYWRSYPERNLHTARRQTRMPGRHQRKIFASPIATATPNTIYTQQGAKPACQEDVTLVASGSATKLHAIKLHAIKPMAKQPIKLHAGKPTNGKVNHQAANVHWLQSLMAQWHNIIFLATGHTPIVVVPCLYIKNVLQPYIWRYISYIYI